MTQYYTRTDGNDANNGLSNTAGGAFLTIKKLIAQTVAGDVGSINAGTYTENVNGNAGGDTINSGTSYSDAPQFNVIGSVTWKCSVGETTALKLNNSQIYMIFTGIIFDGINQTFGGTPAGGGPDLIFLGNGVHHIRFSACEFKDAYGVNVTLGGSPTASHHMEFLNCLNHGTRGTDARYHGLYGSGSPDILIDGGEYYSNRGSGIHLFSGDNSRAIVRLVKIHNNRLGTGTNAALVLGAGSDMLAYNNLIYDEPSLGIQVDFASSAHTGNRVYNNTFYTVGNTDGDSPIQIGASSTTLIEAAQIKNNLIYSCGNGNVIQDFGLNTVIANNFQSSVTNPNFVDLAGKNFQLTASTPGSILNSGATLADVPNDFIGTVRPQGSAYDIGAYELISAGLAMFRA